MDRWLALAAGAVLLAGCNGGSHTYGVPEVKRAFAAHGLFFDSTAPLDLYEGVKDLRAVLALDGMGSRDAFVVVFKTEDAAERYDVPQLAAQVGVQIRRVRNVVVTYEHVSPATEKKIRATLRALR